MPNSTKKHYPLSPSGMERILACPPSVKLSEGIESLDNTYTKEGTQAHEVVEQMLRGESVDGADEDMVMHAKTYVSLVREIESRNFIIDSWIERTLVSSTIEGFGGTPDWHAVTPEKIIIVDYKYGRGVMVKAHQNTQLMSYLLLARELHPRATEFEAWICQPRLHNIGMYVCGAEELDDLRYKILSALTAKDCALGSGAHCRWCPVLPTCPKVRQDTIDLVDDVDGRIPIQKQMELLPVLRALVDAIPAAALTELESGGRIPGFKAVTKLSPRKWVDDNRVVEAKLRKAQVPLKQFMPRKLLSPTQMEKAGLIRHVKDLVTRTELGLTVVPEDDNRPDALGHSILDIVKEADNE